MEIKFCDELKQALENFEYNIDFSTYSYPIIVNLETDDEYNG